jgi:hypothetical protein
MDIIQILTNILRVAPELVILGFCIQYMTTSKTTDGVLLTVGTAIGSLVMIFYTFFYAYFYESDFFRAGGIAFTVLSIMGWAGQILFAVGLILLIKKAMGNWNKSPLTRYRNDPQSPLDSGLR